jgi:uncharacterized membrane protein
MLSSFIEFIQSNFLNLFAMMFFLGCYRGYLHYTARRSVDTPCLAFAMHRYRKQWIRMALIREHRHQYCG